MMTFKRWAGVAAAGLALAHGGLAFGVAEAGAGPQSVVVSGTVPDEATRQRVLTRAREVFGAQRVVDQLGIGPLAAPPHWSADLEKIITPDLKRVSHGQISVNGNVVDIQGDIANEAQRQNLVGALSAPLNSTYTVNDKLRVGAPGQAQIDLALTNRTIEFETGNAVLTPTGLQTLDGLVPVLVRMTGRRFVVTGHTDSLGSRARNIALSAARANAVKAYLVDKGVGADSIATSGSGPDSPIASNDTEAGRARNRRIELRVADR